MIWFSHQKNIGAFDIKNAYIYEIELAPNKVSSVSYVQKEVEGGSYGPVSGLEYDSNSEAIFYSNLSAYNTEGSTKSKKNLENGCYWFAKSGYK